MRLALQHDRRPQRLRQRASTVAHQLELGEAVAGALAAQRQEMAVLALNHLAPLAVDVVEAAVRDEQVALRAAFLVARHRMADFDDALDELGDEHGDRFRVRVVAPLPPYSFTDLYLDLEENDGWASSSSS